MYFSRVRVLGNKPEALIKIIHASDYDQHQLLWKLFPDNPDAERDYLFKRDVQKGFPQFYVVSEREPTPLKDILEVETMPYQPKLCEGDRLSFTLRANPVRTRKVDDHSNKRKRDDVVFLLKKSYQNIGEELPSKAELSQEAGEAWLIERAKKNGFQLDGVRADSYQRHFHKRKGRDIQYSSLDFQGALTVVEPDKFTNVLLNGVGPAKAFGCGLMLVRRM